MINSVEYIPYHFPKRIECVNSQESVVNTYIFYFGIF